MDPTGELAWFGNLDDGVHTGGPNDPRLPLVEVKAKYVTYWKSKVSSLGLLKETTHAAITGQVADIGDQRL